MGNEDRTITPQYRKKLLELLKPSFDSGKISKYRVSRIMDAAISRWNTCPDWYLRSDRYEYAKREIQILLEDFDPARAEQIYVVTNPQFLHD